MKKQLRLPLYIFATMIAAAIMLIMFVALGVWPFGDSSLLTGDLNGQYINYYADIQRNGSVAYSFEKSLGGALEGIFAYYSSSLLSFLYLIVPAVYFAKLSGFVLLLKVALSAGAFCFFIHKKYSSLTWQALLLSQCYAFSSYVFAYSQNIMWMDVIVFLPLVAFGIDMLIEQNKRAAFAITLGLCIFSNFYMGFMVCIFSCMYFVYSLCMKGACARKFYLHRVLSFAAGGLCAGLSNAVLLLPAMINITQSKGIGLTSFSLSFLFSPLLLFRKMFAGSFTINDNLSGLPNIYCGLIALVLLIVYALCKGISKKERACGLSLLGVMLLSLCSNGINLLWHGTKEPVWFLYRNSFIFVFIILLLCARVLSLSSIKPQYFMLSGAFLALITTMIFIFEAGYNVPYLFFSFFSAVLAGAILALYYSNVFSPFNCASANGKHKELPPQSVCSGFAKCKKHQGLVKLLYKANAPILRRALAFACCLFVFFELAINARDILRRQELRSCSSYEQFYNTTLTAVQQLQSRDKYARIEKNFFRALCDPMLLGYRGISHFGSTQDNNSVYPLMSLGYRNFGGSNSYGAGSTAAADSFLNIKHLIASDEGFAAPAHFSPLEKLYGYTLYENPFALPAAFFVDNASALKSFSYKDENPFNYQNEIFRALGSSPLLHSINAKKAFSGSLITFELTAAERGFYYAKLSCSESISAAAITVNGKKLGDYFDYTGFTDVINLGLFDINEAISIEVALSDGVSANAISEMFYYTPYDSMQSTATQLQSLSASAVFIKDEIKLQANGENAVFISVPYSENWSASINGASLDVQKALSHFILVDTDGQKGELILKYKSPFITQSGIISAIGLIFVLILIVLDNKRWLKAILKKRI